MGKFEGIAIDPATKRIYWATGKPRLVKTG
jgi:hypothetical protein